MRTATRRTLLSRPTAAATASGKVLDGISNVVGAYGMHILKTGYAGNCCLVRRSSDDGEAAIGFDGNGDFDSAAFATHVGAGDGFIKTWYDQSGNGRNATQATAASQPQIIVSGMNGKPSPTFDGINDGLTYTGGLSIAQPCSFIGVGSLTDAADANAHFLSGFNYVTAFYAQSSAWKMYSGSVLTGSATNTNDNVFSGIFNGASSVGRVNGVSVVSGNPGAFGYNTHIIIGATWAGTATPWYGEICTVIVLDAALPIADHNSMGDSLATYYGITWTTVS